MPQNSALKKTKYLSKRGWSLVSVARRLHCWKKNGIIVSKRKAWDIQHSEAPGQPGRPREDVFTLDDMLNLPLSVLAGDE